MDRAHRVHLPWRPRHPDPRDGGDSVWLRLRVWLHHWRLDHQIAAGEALSGRLLRMRAGALIERSRREQLAHRFERVVDELDQPQPRMSAAAPLNRRGIADVRPLLLGLARDLRDPDPVSPQGVARAVLLLTDGGGPLYGARPPLFGAESPEDLGVAVRAATTALYLGPSIRDDRPHGG